MKVYLAADHGGYFLKEALKQSLRSWGYQVEDLGNMSLDPNDDYPDFILPCAQKVANDQGSFGIVLGRFGNGEAIAANKVKGIRAAFCLDPQMAKLAREHNNANVLALGANLIDEITAEKIVTVFLETLFTEEERHVRRIDKITSYENTNH